MTQYDQLIDRLIDLAIEEDIATGDVTTQLHHPGSFPGRLQK